MKKIYFLWSLLGLLTLQLGWAQSNITGTVLDETGTPLPGATVIVEGTTRGVATDFDGNFSIEANQGDVLIVTYVGYTAQRVTIEADDNYSILLNPQSELEEVVVTALGIQRQERNLGYGTDIIKSEELVKARESNIINALQGKVTGVNITNTSGNLGSSSKVIIRGVVKNLPNNYKIKAKTKNIRLKKIKGEDALHHLLTQILQ